MHTGLWFCSYTMCFTQCALLIALARNVFTHTNIFLLSHAYISTSGCGLDEWCGRERLMRGRGRRHLIQHLHTSTTHDWRPWRPVNYFIFMTTLFFSQFCHLICCVAGSGYGTFFLTTDCCINSRPIQFIVMIIFDTIILL